MNLKPGSIPTKFSFTEERQKRKVPLDRTKVQGVPSKAARRLIMQLPDEQVDVNEEDDHFLEQYVAEPESNEDVLDRNLQSKEEEISRLSKQWEMKESVLSKKIKELEAALSEEREARKELEIMSKRNLFSIENFKNNDKLLRFYTGFENYDMFSMVLDFLGREAASSQNYRNRDRSADDSGAKPGPERTLSVENEFFMTLCRLKVGLLEEDLASRFAVSQSLVSQTVNTWTKFMFFRFKKLDMFPSREVVELHKPECFSKKYKSTTLIIDATEIYIEQPSNPEAQQVTFSTYKNSNTLKALVGIVPKGSVCFVSELYGGCISDKEITQKSGLVDKLHHGDVIMADRGFNIQEMLAERGVRVNVPPFMNQSGQFEEHEMLATRRIASLRIHVERAIERIKNYHILDFIPITMCKNAMIDMTFFVCAMLTNFLPPLVND